jgi:hypothetical protein
MAWVLFTFRHGPGRQSKTEEYIYFKKATKRAIKEYLDEHDPVGNAFDGPTMLEYKVLRGLPASVRKSKINNYKWRRDHAHKMLKVLERTKSFPEYEWQCTKCTYSRRTKIDTCIYPHCKSKMKKVKRK